MSKFCITGANGKVGRHLVSLLNTTGHEVIGLVRSDSAARMVASAGGTPLQAELHETDELARAFSGCTTVFHLAGTVRGPGKQTAEAVNHQGTKNVLDALLASDRSQLSALVFSSTVAIYGDRSGLWVEEDMPPRPETDYARSKVAAEQVLLNAFSDHGIPTRIARLAAVYGPEFPFMMIDAMQKGRAWLPGEGMNYIPTIQVEDAVRGLNLIAQSGTDGRIYNLSDKNPLQLAEFYEQVHHHIGGSPVRFWSTWIPSYVQERLARRNESIKARLGRRPTFTVDALRLFTASTRMNISRLEEELSFDWTWPNPVDGIAHSIQRK